MKKLKNIICMLVLVLGISFIFVGCNEKDKPCFVTFDTGVEEEDVSQEVKFDDYALKIYPTREGYDFMGWYIDKDYSEKFDFNTKIQSNITLYAKWSNDLDELYSFNLTEDNSFYEITGYFGESKTVKLPVRYNGLRVCSIAEDAFNSNEIMEEVEIPNTIQIIGKSAFANCHALKSLDVPYSVISIEDEAFSNCVSLKTLSLEDGLKSIGDGAFDNCKSLSEVVLPDSVLTVGDVAFRHNDSLERLTLSNNMLKISNAMFQHCGKLEKIDIPESVTEIGNSAFSYCYGLEELNILSNAIIFDSAFYDCQNLSKVYYASSEFVSYGINNYIFYNAGNTSGGIELTLAPNAQVSMNIFVPCGEQNLPNIKSVVFEDETLLIYSDEFNKMPYLESITVPDSVQTIKPNSFDETAWYKSQPNGIVYMDNIIYGYKGEMQESITIKDSAVAIGNDVFNDIEEISLVTILSPYIYVSTAQNPFARRLIENAKEVFVPKEVVDENENTYLNSLIFEKSENDEFYIYKESPVHYRESTNGNGICLTGVDFDGDESKFVIPTSFNGYDVIEIAGEAFKDCGHLNYVYIPSTIEYIGYNAFVNCENLMIVCGAESKPVNWNYYWNGNITDIYWGYTELEMQVLIFGNLSQNLERRNGAIYLTYEGEKYLVKYDEEYLTYLENFEIQTNDTENNFTYSIEIESDTQYIFRDAFIDNIYLSEVIIPSSVNGVGVNAFEGCTNLKTIKTASSYVYNNILSISGLLTNATKIYVPKNVVDESSSSYIDDLKYERKDDGENYLFEQTILNLVVSGDYLKIVGTSLGSEIQELVIPETFNGRSIVTIGASAFENCENLTSVTIPESVSVIEYNAFRNCTNLNTVTILSASIYTNITSKTAFEGLFVNANKIYVLKQIVVNNVNDFLNIKYERKDEGEYYLYESTNFNFYERYDGLALAGFNYADDTQELIVPETFNGKSVTAISMRAFENNTNLTSVTLPASLTSIEANAFRGCTNLKTLKIFSQETYRYAFSSLNFGDVFNYATKIYVAKEIVESTESLLNIKFERRLEDEFYIFEPTIYIFEENGEDLTLTGTTLENSIEELVIPETFNEKNITSIGEYAFDYCSSLTSVTLLSNISEIGYHAFYNCTNLNTIIIHSDTIYLGLDSSSAFNGLFVNAKIIKVDKNLIDTENINSYLVTNFEMTEEGEYYVFTICPYTFSESEDGLTIVSTDFASGLDYIDVPSTFNGKNIVAIGENAFRNGQFKYVKISEGIKSIGANAFYNCTNLSNIYLPESVTEVGNNMLGNCPSDMIVNFAKRAPFSWDVSWMGGYKEPYNYYSLLGFELRYNPERRSELTQKDGAYYYDDGETKYLVDFDRTLTSIVVEEGTDIILDYTFIDSELNEISIASSVQDIGESAFENCPNLVKVTLLSESVYNKTIGFTFQGNLIYYAREIYVPNTFERSYNFDNSLIYSKEEIGNQYKFTLNDFVYKEVEGGLSLERVCSNESEIIVPSSFQDKAVVGVGAFAFKNLSNLTKVTLPESVVVLDSAFSYCDNLQTVIILGNVENIEDCTFNMCQNFESVVFPNSIKLISENAFNGSRNLKNIYYRGTEEKFMAITGYENFLDYVKYYSDGCIHSYGYWREVDNEISAELTINLNLSEDNFITSGIRKAVCSVCGEEFEAFEIINNSSYPFVQNSTNEIKSGNNGRDNTTSTYKIVAKQNITISFSYKVSSEQSYDKLTIRKEGGQFYVNGISGNTSYVALTVELQLGETLVISYSKDSSQSSGSDCCYIKDLNFALN